MRVRYISWSCHDHRSRLTWRRLQWWGYRGGWIQCGYPHRRSRLWSEFIWTYLVYLIFLCLLLWFWYLSVLGQYGISEVHVIEAVLGVGLGNCQFGRGFDLAIIGDRLCVEAGVHSLEASIYYRIFLGLISSLFMVCCRVSSCDILSYKLY